MLARLLARLVEPQVLTATLLPCAFLHLLLSCGCCLQLFANL
jgi:hypothetical protein